MRKIVFSINGKEIVTFELPETDLDVVEKNGFLLYLKNGLPALYKNRKRFNKYDKMEFSKE